VQLPDKTWVIPDKEIPPRERTPRLSLVPSSGGQGLPEAGTSGRMAIPAVLLIAMTYLPGPLAPLVVPDAGGRLVKGIALLFGTTWGLFLWQRAHLAEVFRAGPWALGALGGVLIAVTFLGFAVWSRTVVRAGRELKPRLPRSPRWVHSPPVILVLGACLPGLGLLLAGRTRRAGWALWTAFPVLWCAVVLVHSPMLWNLHLAHGWDLATSRTFEWVFILSGIAGLAAALLWTVQALDGMRLEIAWQDRGGRPRSDWMAGFLLVALGVLLVSAKPASVAQELDTLARNARNDDLLLCPTGLTWVAEHLDPSRPVYTMHLASLYDELGWSGRAEELRISLETRWRAYEAARDGREGNPWPLVGPPAVGLGFHEITAD
jgi:hypothetical protein